VRLVNPTDSAVGEQPGFRGYALPLLQRDRSALTLGVLAAGWHLPLVVLGRLGLVGLPVTVAVTVVYVWLFNHADGSVLLPIVLHATEGAISFGDLGFAGADATAHGAALRRGLVRRGAGRGRARPPRLAGRAAGRGAVQDPPARPELTRLANRRPDHPKRDQNRPVGASTRVMVPSRRSPT
jgi:hypothetical protein